jgi:hypothetical protein
MTEHNTNIIQVLWDNLFYIGSGVASWALAAFGGEAYSILGLILIDLTFFTVVDWIINNMAILLSCAVSVATLFKMRDEIKKKDRNGKKN